MPHRAVTRGHRKGRDKQTLPAERQRDLHQLPLPLPHRHRERNQRDLHPALHLDHFRHLHPGVNLWIERLRLCIFIIFYFKTVFSSYKTARISVDIRHLFI